MDSARESPIVFNAEMFLAAKSHLGEHCLFCSCCLCLIHLFLLAFCPAAAPRWQSLHSSAVGLHMYRKLGKHANFWSQQRVFWSGCIETNGLPWMKWLPHVVHLEGLPLQGYCSSLWMSQKAIVYCLPKEESCKVPLNILRSRMEEREGISPKPGAGE